MNHLSYRVTSFSVPSWYVHVFCYQPLWQDRSHLAIICKPKAVKILLQRCQKTITALRRTSLQVIISSSLRDYSPRIFTLWPILVCRPCLTLTPIVYRVWRWCMCAEQAHAAPKSPAETNPCSWPVTNWYVGNQPVSLSMWTSSEPVWTTWDGRTNEYKPNNNINSGGVGSVNETRHRSSHFAVGGPSFVTSTRLPVFLRQPTTPNPR